MEVAIGGRDGAQEGTRCGERSALWNAKSKRRSRTRVDTEHRTHTHTYTRVNRTSTYAETRCKKRTHAILRSLPRVLTVDVDFSLSKCRSRFSPRFQPTSEAAA